MRAARFTGAPTTAYLERLREPMLPTTTSPVWMPTPICTSGRSWAWFQRLTRSMTRSMARAQATARAVSSSRWTGAPKMVRMASPMNSSMVPWCLVMTSVISER